MEGIDLKDILPILNLAWFERCDDGTFVFCGNAPEWLVSLYPEAVEPNSRLRPDEKFLFLAHFLEEAVPFWESAPNGRLKSGLWQETGDCGSEYLLEASAVRIEDRQVLLIEGVEDETRRALIQTAREKQLAYIRELQAQSLAIKTITTEKEFADTASKAKSEFLASMSHEIRTAMNSILGYTQLLQLNSDLSDKQRRYIETVERSGHHLMSLINDILDLAKIEAGREELRTRTFCLHKFAVELSDMFQIRCTKKQLAWKMEAPAEEIWVQGDERKLRQVMINLLDNAVKFTDSGTVEMHVENLGEDRFRFEVCDTGPGIPLEKQARIFEAFRQEREGRVKGGTGLGLAISRKLVDLMGGDLDLHSTPGKGTCFFFSLSLATKPRIKLATPEANLNRRLDQNFKVHAVLVDDDVEDREIIEGMLTHLGITIDGFKQSQDALRFMQQKKPDIVFLDTRLLQQDVVSTMLQIWKIFGRKTVSVVAVSASALAPERRRYLAAGFDAFIDKPVLSDRLCSCLTELLGVTFREM